MMLLRFAMRPLMFYEEHSPRGEFGQHRGFSGRGEWGWGRELLWVGWPGERARDWMWQSGRLQTPIPGPHNPDSPAKRPLAP